MNETLFSILLIGMLLVFSSTAMAHDGEAHAKDVYEEGSGGSSMHEMGNKAEGMAHEYKGKQGEDHSKEYYEKKYGKYEHEKKGMQEEGSGMKDEAMKMKDMEHQRKEEGSKM
jgi:hypothetical protein